MKAIKTKRAIYEVLSENPTSLVKVAQCTSKSDTWVRLHGVATARQSTVDKVIAHPFSERIELTESELDDLLVELTSKRKALLARNRVLREQAQERELAQLAAWLDDAKNADGVIPATFDNVRLLLCWLNAQNWGFWHLPNLDVGYSCYQYATGRGGTATTIKLDEAIETPFNGWCKKFAHGAGTAVPMGYLYI